MNIEKKPLIEMKHLLVIFTLLLLISCGSNAPSTAADCAANTLLFTHDMLVNDAVCIPERPTRIAALDPFTFEAMVALDAPMVATSGAYMDELLTYAPQFDEMLQSVTDSSSPVNFETLIDVQPDVILCRRTACERNARRLRQIAPTVIFDNTSAADWRESARFYAEVIGMETEMAAIEQDYDERAAMIAASLGDQSTTLSVMRIQPGRLRLYFERSFAGTVLAAAGFVYPDGQADEADASRDDQGRPQLANISEERLSLLEADYAFVYVTENLGEDDAQAYLDELRSQSLWQSLGVVQRGDLHVVGTYWFAAGYVAAHGMLDDLSDVVLGINGEVDNPFK
ncbi:MAG: ABC transporter substrate-binding protein [Chloroflexota bacterium]